MRRTVKDRRPLVHGNNGMRPRGRIRRRDIGVSKQVGTVYMLEFVPPYKHCQHTIGFTERPVAERLAEHRAGGKKASRICRAAVRAGCKIELVRTWENVNQWVEMALKSRGESRKLCPKCSGPEAYNYAQYDRPGTSLTVADPEPGEPMIGAF